MFPSLPSDLFAGHPAVVIVIPAPQQHACPWQQRQSATLESVRQAATSATYAAHGDDTDDATIARFVDHAFRRADAAVGSHLRYSAPWIDVAHVAAVDMIP